MLTCTVQCLAGSRLYLIVGTGILVFQLLTIILPYASVYIQCSHAPRSFGNGSWLEYKGTLNLDLATIDIDIVVKGLSGNNAQVYLTLVSRGNHTVLYRGETIVSVNSPLLRFLLPPADNVTLVAPWALAICVRKPTRFIVTLPPSPTEFGVPYVYAAMIKGPIWLIDEFYNQTCSAVQPGKPHNYIIHEYAVLKGGYLLWDYTADYTVRVVDESTEPKPLLVSILGGEFPAAAKLLERIAVRQSKVLNSSSISVGETLNIQSGNVCPVDQAWLDAIIGTYMFSTPISQLLTAAGIILILIYKRGG